MGTRTVVELGVLVALSLVLMFTVNVPLMPAATYLKYDPGDVPLSLVALRAGPGPAVLALAVKNVLYVMLKGGRNPLGIVMNLVASGTFLLVLGTVYRVRPGRGGLVGAAVAATVSMAAVMVPANAVGVPLIHGTSLQRVWALMLPVYVPFNLIKGSLNGLLVLAAHAVLPARGVALGESLARDRTAP